jgi:CubicO group peptidase (beta-lactamase class C family)
VNTRRRVWLWMALAAAGLGAGLVVALSPARPGSSAATRGEVHGALGEQLDRYLTRLEAFGFSGSLLVARHGGIVIDKGYGLAEREHGIPYTAGTLFDVASISKQFTAAAVLKLEMAGRLAVEDTLGKFFPDAPPDKAPISLHQLLTHTAGIVDTVGGEYEPVSRQEMLRRAFAAPLQFAPGRRYRYSNAGYSLLAAVVETVSGQPLGDYLRSHLFLPAGMRHTGHRLPPLDRQPLAHGYTRDGADWGTPLDHPWAPDGPFWDLRGNGGILSTTGDMYRWHLALAGNSVLSSAEREKYQTPYVSEGRQSHSHYAYGWSVTRAPDGTRLLSHVGGNLVFEADFRRYVDDRSVIVMSANGADFSALAVSPHVEARLYGHPDPDPPAPVAGAPEVAARCAGDYAVADGERLRVEALHAGTGASAGAGAGSSPSGGAGAGGGASGSPAGSGRLTFMPQGPRGLALLTSGASADLRDLLADHAEKAAAVLEPLRQGDYAPLAHLMGLPLEDTLRLARPPLDEVKAALGAWTGARMLGSALLGGHLLTYARFDFERGSRFAELLWEGPAVEAVRYAAGPPAFSFVPVAPAVPGAAPDLAFFEVREGSTLRARCEPGPDGNAIALVIASPAGAVRLPRIVG